MHLIDQLHHPGNQRYPQQDTDGLRATINPYGTSSTLLAANTKYQVVVTTGSQDLAGNALDQDPMTAGNQQKSWTFTTKG